MAQPVTASFTTTTPASSTSTTFNMPTTRPDDDLYVLFALKDDDPEFTKPSPEADHWNFLFNEVSPDNTNLRYQAWWWWGSSEPASYTMSHDAEIAKYTVIRITGAHATTPIDSSGSLPGDSTDGTTPAITVVNDDTLVIRAMGVDTDNITVWPDKLIDQDDSVGSGDVSFAITWEDGPAAGNSTGAGSYTHANDEWIGLTVAIAPAAVAGSRRVFMIT